MMNDSYKRSKLIKAASLFIALVLVFCAVPATRVRASAEGRCGSAAFWSYNNGVLRIRGSDAMYDFDAFFINGNLTSLTPWESYKEDITRVVIESGITKIGAASFSMCKSLRTVKIPDTVTGIGSFAFFGCSDLSKVTLMNVKSIGSNAFDSCSDLMEIDLGNSLVTIGSAAFENCTSLFSIDLPSSLKNINSSAFLNCSSLERYTIPDSVTYIGGRAFKGTPRYEDDNNYEDGNLYLDRHLIRVSETATGDFTVKEGTLSVAGCAFENCTGMTSVIIPEGVAGVGDNVFRNCTSLSYVKLPKSLTKVRLSFLNGCPTLVDAGPVGSGCAVEFSWDTEIPEYAFSGTEVLSSVQLPDSVETIGIYAFYKCNGISEITIPDKVTYIPGDCFCGCESLEKVEYPDSLTEIHPYAFAYCDKFTEVSIPDGVTSISMGAYYNCKNLKILRIPESVTSVDMKAFTSCSSLTDIFFDGTREQWESIYRSDRFSKAYVHIKGEVCTHKRGNVEVIKRATCTEDGIAEYTCTLCGERITETLKAKGHRFKVDEFGSTAPTYTSSGTERVVCVFCGYSEEHVIPRLELDVGKGDVNGDGGIDLKDILIFRKLLAGAEDENNVIPANADVNKDEMIDLKDLLLIRYVLSGIIG